MKKTFISMLIIIFSLFFFSTGVNAIPYKLTLESYAPAALPTVSTMIDIASSDLSDISIQIEISRLAKFFAYSQEGWGFLSNLDGVSIGMNTLSPAVGWSGTAHQYWVYGNHPDLNELFGYELNQEAINYGESARILTFHTDDWVARLSHDIGESPNNTLSLNMF